MELYCTDGSKCQSTGCSQTHQVCREKEYVRSETIESLRKQLTTLQAKLDFIQRENTFVRAKLEVAEKDAANRNSRMVYGWIRHNDDGTSSWIDLPEKSLPSDTPVFTYTAAPAQNEKE